MNVLILYNMHFFLSSAAGSQRSRTPIKALLFNTHTIAKVRNSTFSKARVPLGTNISAMCFNPDSSTFFEYKIQKD